MVGDRDRGGGGGGGAGGRHIGHTQQWELFHRNGEVSLNIRGCGRARTSCRPQKPEDMMMTGEVIYISFLALFGVSCGLGKTPLNSLYLN